MLFEADADANMMHGQVTAVRGTVVDAWFENGLPPIDSALKCELDQHGELDQDGHVIAVVHSHLGDSSVRAIATSSTRGIRRGALVCCNGTPLRIPVGKQLVGRVIDLHGNPLDEGPALTFARRSPLFRPEPAIIQCKSVNQT